MITKRKITIEIEYCSLCPYFNFDPYDMPQRCLKEKRDLPDLLLVDIPEWRPFEKIDIGENI